jgi:hypothetical protein
MNLCQIIYHTFEQKHSQNLAGLFSISDAFLFLLGREEGLTLRSTGQERLLGKTGG